MVNTELNQEQLIASFIDALKKDLDHCKEVEDYLTLECIATILAYFENSEAKEIMYTTEGVVYCLKELVSLETSKQTVFIDNNLDAQFDIALNKVIAYQEYLNVFEEALTSPF